MNIRKQRLSCGVPQAFILGVVAVFVWAALPDLAALIADPDEGVYLRQSERILSGDVPLRDFFVHQIPGYAVWLSMVRALDGSLTEARTLSFIAWATGGFLLAIWAMAQGISWLGAFVLVAIWMLSPLQINAMQAIPEPTAIFFVMCALTLVGRQSKNWHLFCAGVLMGVCVAFKYALLPLVFGVVGMLIAVGRSRQLWKIGAGFLLTLGSISVYFAWHAGPEVLALVELQWQRIAGGHPLTSYALAIPQDMAQPMPYLRWNFLQHRFLFTGVAGLATLGVVCIVWSISIRRVVRRIATDVDAWLAVGLPICALSLLLPAVPMWAHYHLMYVPLLALASARVFKGDFAGLMLPISVILVCIMVVGYVQAAQDLRRTNAIYYANMASLKNLIQPGDRILSLSPLTDYLIGAEPACDLDDPLNTYNNLGPLQGDVSGALRRFAVSPDQIIGCLERDASIRVLLTPWFDIVAGPRLSSYVRRLPASRILANSF